MPVEQTFSVAYNTTGIGSAIRVPGLHIEASTSQPVFLTVDANVTTTFNATTTNVLTLGTTTTATEIVGASGINEASATYQPNVGSLKLTADADIYVKFAQTGTAATQGAADLFISIRPMSTVPIV